MNTNVNNVLKAIYNERKINPKIKSISVEMTGSVVSWKVTIEESDDGKAWVGLTSRGGAGGGASKGGRPDIETQLSKKKKGLPGEIGESSIDFNEVLNYINTQQDIRQVFIQYTSPTKYPPLPSNAATNAPSDGLVGPQSANPANANQPQANPTLPYLIKSKISLKKISGPGEIVGVVEVDAIDGRADFSGIQFTDPGNYIIQVLPSNSQQLIGTTFSVTVSGEPIEEQPQTGEDKPITGNRPIIAQIDEPRVKLKPMVHPASDNNIDNASIATSTGAIPFVYYDGTQINPVDIDNLELYYEDCVPKIRMTINDTTGRLRIAESNPIRDPKIQIFMNPGSSVLKFIHLQFIITSNSERKNGLLTIFGTLDIKGFYKKSTKSYKSTSFNALREFAKDMDLGFNSNITDTDDEQVWSRKNGTGSDFIKEVFQHAYINDDTFVMAYIDYYYCLTYVDVQKELERDITSDVGLLSNGVTLATDTPEEKKIVPMIISNEYKAHGGPFTFMSPAKVTNNTEQINRQYGTQTESKSYDRLGKKFLVFVVDALTGDRTKNVETRTEDDMKTNTLPSFGGKVDYDSVHKNYAIAYDMQVRNFLMLSNNTAECYFPTPNFNIYRYQKIKAIFVNPRTTATDPEVINVRQTGEWTVLEISFIFKKGTLSQKVILGRRELSKTAEEINREVVEPDKKDNAEINENPDTENKIVPNSTYTVGQRVLVEQNGKQYIIEVTSVLDNGVDIEGTITDFNIVSEKTSESMQADTPVGEQKPSEKGEVTLEQANSRSKNSYNYSYLEKEMQLGLFKQITIKDKDSKIIMTVDNISEPMISQSNLIWLAVEKSGDQLRDPSETPTPTQTPAGQEYIIGMKDPKTDNDKKITGKIVIESGGSDRIAKAEIGGFPDGKTIGPIEGGRTKVGLPVDGVIGESLIRLQDLIIQQYNTNITLEVKN